MELSALLLTLAILGVAEAQQLFFNQRVRAGLGAMPHRKAIPSSSDSFMIQMPLRVVDKDNEDHRINSNEPTLVALGGDGGEQINFYTIKCNQGEKCSSIIPGQVVTQRPKLPSRSKEEIRKYLRDHNLSRGFGFSNNNNKPDLASKHFIDAIENQRNQRNSRRYQFSNFQDYDDYWPGSNLRPKTNQRNDRLRTNYPFSTTNSFDGRSFRHSSSSSSNWPRSFSRNQHGSRKLQFEVPSPSFDNSIEWPYLTHQNEYEPKQYTKAGYNNYYDNFKRNKEATEKPKYKPSRNDVQLRRFSTSVVSQLDKDSGKWQHVSSNINNLDTHPHYYKKKRPLVFKYKKPYGNDDRKYKDKTSIKQTSTGLTVLGVTETNGYHQSSPSLIETDGNLAYFPTRPWSSTPADVFNSFPTRPWKIPGGIDSQSSGKNPTNAHQPPRPSSNSSKPASLLPISASTHVSYPLYVLPAEPSKKVVSEDPATALANSLTTTTTTTTRRTTRRTTTTTTRKPKKNNGGGGGGGSFLNNPNALLAAVGVGLIPATFAALLPVILGKKRKRRRRRSVEGREGPAPSSDLLHILPQILDSIRLHSYNTKTKR